MPMGLCSAAYVCQSITNVIVHIQTLHFISSHQDVDRLKEKVVRLSSGNEASMHNVNNGRTKDKIMIMCAMEIVKITGKITFYLGSNSWLPSLMCCETFFQDGLKVDRQEENLESSLIMQ